MSAIASCSDLAGKVLNYVCECVEDCLTSVIYRGCCHEEEVAGYFKETPDAVATAIKRLVKDGKLTEENETVYPTAETLKTIWVYRDLSDQEMKALITKLKS